MELIGISQMKKLLCVLFATTVLSLLLNCNYAENENCLVKEIWSAPSVSDFKGQINSSVILTFDDPQEYRGPVIKGWEPGKDRNLTVYVQPEKNTIKLNPMRFQKNIPEKIELVILQHSAPRNGQIRMTNRISWMKYTQSIPEIQIMFVIGIPTKSADDLENIDENLQREIENEFQNFWDVLQVDSYESYSNNTLKSIHAFKYLLGLDWSRLSQSGKPPRFVMRTDDDVYINVPLVKKMILQNQIWSSINKKSGWLPMLGYLLVNSPINQIPGRNMKDQYAPRNMYECPTYFYKSETGVYPTYMQGAGYFIPWWAMSCIYQQSFQVPYFFIEDVFIGGFLGDRCLLPKQHLDGFNMDSLQIPIQNVKPNFDIMFHHVKTKYKMELHRHLSLENSNLGDSVPHAI